MSSLFSVESSPGVTLQAEWWTPSANSATSPLLPLLLFVHQYSLLGGSRELMKGMARNAASDGFEAVTFDLRGAGDSSGSFSFFNKKEKDDVLSMIHHIEKTSSRSILIIGSSAGAALAGSVLDSSPRVVGGIFVGYTWGWWSSLLFGWAYSSIRKSEKPKLFVVGTADEFTSIAQYESQIAMLKGEINEMVVIEGKNHFEIEAPMYDKFIIKNAIQFVKKISNFDSKDSTCREETT